jgi:hypothetical protein
MSAGVAHKPLAPFGVEATVDLSQPLGEAQVLELRALFARDGLLVLRGQSSNSIRPTRASMRISATTPC